MPRKKTAYSDTKVIDISDMPEGFIKSLDELMSNELKALGKGNRTDIDGVAGLMRVLCKIRNGTPRTKIANLNKEELSNPEVLEALETLGVFKRILTKDALKDLKTNCQPYDASLNLAINKAAGYYLKIVTKYL
jgi:hypothetical protein